MLTVLFSIVRSEPIATTSSPSVKPTDTPSTSTTSTDSLKVKRQNEFNRPPNYSPYVGDMYAQRYADQRRYADQNAQTLYQVDQKDANGNYNYE